MSVAALLVAWEIQIAVAFAMVNWLIYVEIILVV